MATVKKLLFNFSTKVSRWRKCGAPGFGLMAAFFFFYQSQHSCGQSISISISSPGSGAIAHENLGVTAQVTSTFQLQSVQASVEDRTNQLGFSSPNWTGTLSLAGLTRGNKVLTVVATDVFGNSNQVQRSFVYDLPPTLMVTSPTNGAVVRSNVQLTASATDDGPTPPIIQVLNGGELARGTNTLNAIVVLSDGQALTLTFRATDSLGQTTNITRQVYVQLSSNLVEVARVSDGEISDVASDRVLFISSTGSSNRLMTRLLSDGTENILYGTNVSVDWAYLTTSGAVFTAPMNDASLAKVLEIRDGSLLQRGPFGDGNLDRNGNFLFWGKDSTLYLGDLGTTNTSAIPNTSGYHDFLAPDGSLLLTGGVPSHSILRYSAGNTSTLASDPNVYFDYPQTDGSNVCCIIFPPGTNSMLVFLTNGSTAKIADSPVEYQMNNGWIAYTRSGAGQYQIWRRSPEGMTTQLTFYGTGCTLGALAPNGEVAFYNNLHLYISKGNWPPVDVGFTPTNYVGPFLKPLWLNGRWYAKLGGSLFQVYTGTPQIAGPQITGNTFRFDVVGAIGQSLVSQGSTDLLNWIDFATNNIADGVNMGVVDSVPSGSPSRYYRLKLQ